MVHKYKGLEISYILLWHAPGRLEQPGSSSCNCFLCIHMWAILTSLMAHSFSSLSWKSTLAIKEEMMPINYDALDSYWLEGRMVDHVSLPSLNPPFFNLSTSSQCIPSSLHKSKGKMKWGSFRLECQTAFDILLSKRLKVFWQKEFCIQNLWHRGILVWDFLCLSALCFLVSCWEELCNALY